MVAAYAVYFDYKRRNDPQFRKQLKKESKRQARAAKEEAEANTVRQREAIRAAVEEAKEDESNMTVLKTQLAEGEYRVDKIVPRAFLAKLDFEPIGQKPKNV